VAHKKRPGGADLANIVADGFSGEEASVPRTGWGLITRGTEGSYMQLQDYV
jgi:hypothetical protein